MTLPEIRLPAYLWFLFLLVVGVIALVKIGNNDQLETVRTVLVVLIGVLGSAAVQAVAQGQEREARRQENTDEAWRKLRLERQEALRSLILKKTGTLFMMTNRFDQALESVEESTVDEFRAVGHELRQMLEQPGVRNFQSLDTEPFAMAIALTEKTVNKLFQEYLQAGELHWNWLYQIADNIADHGEWPNAIDQRETAGKHRLKRLAEAAHFA